jgi:hypothetical protein
VLARDLQTPSHLVLSGFAAYRRTRRVELVEGDAELPENVELLAEGTQRLGLRETHWRVVRRPGDRPLSSVDRSEYQDVRFPLSNREWRELLDPR